MKNATVQHAIVVKFQPKVRLYEAFLDVRILACHSQLRVFFFLFLGFFFFSLKLKKNLAILSLWYCECQGQHLPAAATQAFLTGQFQ